MRQLEILLHRQIAELNLNKTKMIIKAQHNLKKMTKPVVMKILKMIMPMERKMIKSKRKEELRSYKRYLTLKTEEP